MGTKRNGWIQSRLPLWLLAGLLAGCHATADPPLGSSTEIYYPVPPSPAGSVSMGAGDALGWHLVATPSKTGWVTGVTGGWPVSTRRLSVDPFVKHGVVGVHGSHTDPLAQ